MTSYGKPARELSTDDLLREAARAVENGCGYAPDRVELADALRERLEWLVAKRHCCLAELIYNCPTSKWRDENTPVETPPACPAFWHHDTYSQRDYGHCMYRSGHGGKHRSREGTEWS